MITYKAGNPHFGGQTSFRVSEAGEAVVEQTRAAETRTFARVLGGETYQHLKELLIRAGEQPLTLASTPPVPGENRICIEGWEPARVTNLEFWTNQRWGNVCLDAFMRALEQAITQTSDGHVKF
jgi:hypothetical protein